MHIYHGENLKNKAKFLCAKKSGFQDGNQYCIRIFSKNIKKSFKKYYTCKWLEKMLKTKNENDKKRLKKFVSKRLQFQVIVEKI